MTEKKAKKGHAPRSGRAFTCWIKEDLMEEMERQIAESVVRVSKTAFIEMAIRLALESNIIATKGQ